MSHHSSKSVKWFVYTREQKCCNTCKNSICSKCYKLKTFALECTLKFRKKIRTSPGPLSPRKKIWMPLDYPLSREKNCEGPLPSIGPSFVRKNPECHKALRLSKKENVIWLLDDQEKSMKTTNPSILQRKKIMKSLYHQACHQALHR